MTSDDLSPEQARQVNEVAGRQLRYVNRLVRRMEQLRFPPDDALLRAALRAQDALQGLTMAAHYASCKHDVGRLPKTAHEAT